MFPDFDIFLFAFSKADKMLPVVALMYLVSFLTVPLIQLIKSYKISPIVYLPLYGLIQAIIIVLALGDCAYFALPPATAMFASVEMARLNMKVHAYFREKVINGLNKDGEVALFVPEWAKRSGMKA